MKGGIDTRNRAVIAKLAHDLLVRVVGDAGGAEEAEDDHEEAGIGDRAKNEQIGRAHV